MGRTKTKIIGEEPKTQGITPSKQKEPADLPQKPETAVVTRKPKTPPVLKSSAKKKFRGKKYLANQKLVDYKRIYHIDDAVALLKKISTAKFDQTVEVHIKTLSKKGQDPLRQMVTLPSGSPKSLEIKIADDKIIEEIKTGKVKFDVLLATPDMMAKLAPVAKILGPRGLMPNPKSGTVTSDPQATEKELRSGKVECKTDSQGNIHLALGKISWENSKISANINGLLGALPSNRIGSVSLCSTMGPGIRIG